MDSSSRDLRRISGRVLLGLVVGGSFGIYIGALVASWVYGVAAIEERAVEASYLAAGVTLLGAVVGAVLAYRRAVQSAPDDPAAPIDTRPPSQT